MTFTQSDVNKVISPILISAVVDNICLNVVFFIYIKTDLCVNGRFCGHIPENVNGQTQFTYIMENVFFSKCIVCCHCSSLF